MRLGYLNHDSVDEDTTRISSSDFIEARHRLRPALDLFERAIRAAEVGGGATGELLQLVCTLENYQLKFR